MPGEPKPSKPTPFFTPLVVALLVLVALATLLYGQGSSLTDLLDRLLGNPSLLYVPLGCLGCFMIHFLVLTFSRSLSTHSARQAGLVLTVLLPLALIAALAAWEHAIYNPEGAVSMGRLAFIPLLMLVWFPGVIVYSMPSSFFGALPLLLHYLAAALIIYLVMAADNLLAALVVSSIFIFAYFPLAGYLFPRHRRLKAYLKPTRLPRIKPRGAGFTLIELLIVVAIIAILSVSLVNLSSVTHRVMGRQEDWRRSISLAEDEIALLRARPALPAMGRHPIEPALARLNPIANQAEVEIRPGPSARLREVRVSIRLHSEADQRDVTLAAILPAQSPPKESAK